jgi:hypothetical protein
MKTFAVIPDNGGAIRYYTDPHIQTPEQAANRYGLQNEFLGTVTVEDTKGKETRFRLSLHTSPAWGTLTSHSIIATEIPEGQEAK